jgi:hypothetical protein
MMEGMSVQAATDSKIILIRAKKVAENRTGTTREKTHSVSTAAQSNFVTVPFSATNGFFRLQMLE